MNNNKRQSSLRRQAIENALREKDLEHKEIYSLHLAASRGENGLLTTLLMRNERYPGLSDVFQVNQPDDKGNTALHLAASEGFRKTARILCKFGASVHLKNNQGETPLAIAIKRANNATLNAMLAYVPKLVYVGDLYQVALRCRNNEAVLLLIARNFAGVDCADHTGDTPLHLAVDYGSPEVIRKLLEFGADPHVQNKDEETPLQLAQSRATLTDDDGPLKIIQEHLLEHPEHK